MSTAHEGIQFGLISDLRSIPAMVSVEKTILEQIANRFLPNRSFFLFLPTGVDTTGKGMASIILTSKSRTFSRLTNQFQGHFSLNQGLIHPKKSLSCPSVCRIGSGWPKSLGPQ